MDVKCGVVGLLEAATALLQGQGEGRGPFVPRRTLMFAFGHDEEVRGGGGWRVEAGHGRGGAEGDALALGACVPAEGWAHSAPEA